MESSEARNLDLVTVWHNTRTPRAYVPRCLHPDVFMHMFLDVILNKLAGT